VARANVPKQREVCQWLTLQGALTAFVLGLPSHQSARHIRRMHWYVATRLVVEGGFSPDDITPRPPFRVVFEPAGGSRVKALLHYDEARAGGGERTVLGGLKTKNVDVVVSLDGIGPCVAVSMKGTLNAFRNLTNRLEEAVGDCTNIHIAYPALVYGFLHLLRANTEGTIPDNGKKFLVNSELRNTDVLDSDVAIWGNGSVSTSITRYHDALARLAGRRDMRDDITRYESMSTVLVSPGETTLGQAVASYPPVESALHFDRFFQNLYEQYDMRFVYGAPNLANKTRRLEWDPKSPALTHDCIAGLTPRTANSTGMSTEDDESSDDDPDA
jgi:hypothetical protein